MNIVELTDTQMNKAVAYILGLIYPLYKEKQLNEEEYILGCINHNSKMVTESDLSDHYISVSRLINKYMGQNKPLLKANKTADYLISPKKGFAVLIEKTDFTQEECIKMLSEKVEEIKYCSEEIKIEFVKGCFDGRGSWDKTAHYFSIDVDRDYNKQDLITEIVESLNVNLNVNRREENHTKNDQLRIKKESLDKFMVNIGLYSKCRKKIIESARENL